MSKHPKSEIRKQRLPNCDQIEYFRLGHTSIFHVQNFQEQFLEFWHNFPAAYREDDDDDNDSVAHRDRQAFMEQHYALNEDEFKHNIHALPNDLSTNDLIVPPPHTIIKHKINTAAQHYMQLNNEKESDVDYVDDNDNENNFLIDDELASLTITHSTTPNRKKRKLNNNSISNNTFIVNDSDSDFYMDDHDLCSDDIDLEPQIFKVKIEIENEQNTNNNNTSPPLRRSKRIKNKNKNMSEKSEKSENSENSENSDNDIIIDKNDKQKERGCPPHINKRKRKRKRKQNMSLFETDKKNKNKRKNKRSNDRPHVLFAHNVEMPYFDQLTIPFTKYQHRRNQHKITNSKKEVNSVTKLSRNHRFQAIEQEKGCKLLREHECLLNVAIFHSNKSAEKYTKSHEYVVLSTQRLCELRDCFYCLMDETPIGKQAKNSYFFIEDTFYDDMRHDGSVRLSTDIIDWSLHEKHWLQTGVYQQKNMQNVQFCDLNIRLGSHYLYVHQGNCQHMVVFTQCRIASGKWDQNNCFVYPITVYRQILKRQKCGVCGMCPAKYVTYGDKLTTHNPFFFCEQCYYPFHYDKHDKLLYHDFQVFDYIHD